MGRRCSFPNCNNKQKTWSAVSFHKLPLDEPKRYKLWLRALEINPDTPKKTLRRRCILVCSDHFSPDDLIHHKGCTHPKPTAVPNPVCPADQTAAGSANVSALALHDTLAAMDRPPDQVRSTDASAEICTATVEKPALQHIVDEEAILQLMKNCPMCDRKCRCTKYTRGPYFIVYQSCYFCSYQRKWASQPEARNINIHKATPKKKPRPKDKASGNAKAPASKPSKTSVSESSAPESKEPSET
ncbi:THAP domain-containing protein 5-like [Plectropomus leopardus]|uniref:THAP domain-containing protein 5-like n=1 Tax=Plectropomus leopardus TaxID=160734 RepID=UPI001C4CD960|nr:THAP domain-containing protein 5-like [Plectropomus leopardus]